MKLYSATVHLSGSIFNQVRKTDLTPAEIIILKRMHGGDAIKEIAATGDADRSDEAERERLHDTYGAALRSIENVKTIEGILGVAGMPLPAYVPGVENLPAPKAGKRAPKEAPVEPVEPIKEDEFA